MNQFILTRFESLEVEIESAAANKRQEISKPARYLLLLFPSDRQITMCYSAS